MKAKQFSLLKRLYPLVIVLAMVAAVILIIFLYNNFYQTMARAKEISLLRSQVALEVVDLNLFKKVKSALEAKTNPRTTIDWSELKNPFLSY